MKEKQNKKKHKCDLVTTLFHSLLGNGKSPQPLKLQNIKKGKKPQCLRLLAISCKRTRSISTMVGTHVPNNLPCMKVLMMALS
jgi:hypothetical protein